MSKEAYDIPPEALNEQAVKDGGLQILHEDGAPVKPHINKPSGSRRFSRDEPVRKKKQT